MAPGRGRGYERGSQFSKEDPAYNELMDASKEARAEQLKKQAEELRAQAKESGAPVVTAEAAESIAAAAEEETAQEPIIVETQGGGEYSGKGETVDLSGIDLGPVEVEEAPTEEPEETPADKPQGAQVATAYGGHTAQAEVGGDKASTESTIEVSSMDADQAKEKNLEAARVEMQRKLDAGMEASDYLMMVEGSIDDLEYDIEDMKKGEIQETFLKDMEAKLDRLYAQRDMLAEMGAENEDETEVEAGTGDAPAMAAK